jgi:serine/threonine-protein kinase
VADFGIAHLESSELTQVGTVLGTPAYMSPEQILGLPVDGRSDLFSVGVILYQFLTGERPFTGNATITMRKVLEEDPLPPSRFNVQIPGAMDAVVRKALAKKPDERFQSAEEFAAALDAAAHADREHSGETTLAPPAKPFAGSLAGSATAATTGRAKPLAAPATTTATGAAAPKSQRAALAVVAVVVVVAIGVAVWFITQRRADAPDKTVQAAVVPLPGAALPPPAAGAGAVAGGGAGTMPAAPIPVAVAPKTDPGALLISAVGLVDPSAPRYQGDQALLQSDLRADSRSQLVEKAVGLLVDTGSVAKNYDLLKDKLMSRSGDFVTTVVRESAPQTGKDGLVSLTTEAVVNVRAVQKSLNEMSRNERIEFIRASGDPRVAVRIVTRDADAPDAPPRLSSAAENILKERIKSFGFRTWSENGSRVAESGPDFVVEGEATIKRLSMKLAASGLVITKYGLNGWTIKCIDRATGEEIYYNTKLPTGEGSWASEEEAFKAIGTKIGAEFSRDFFLQHVNPTGRKVMLKVEGMPPTITDEQLARELTGLPAVITVAPGVPARPRVYELQVAGSGAAADIVAATILKSLNAKLGQACFSVGAVAGDDVAVVFDARCNDAAVLARLETNPPASLYGAPPARQKSVVKNAETLKKLMI